MSTQRDELNGRPTKYETEHGGYPLLVSAPIFRYRIKLDISVKGIETPKFTVEGTNCTREEFLKEFDEFRKTVIRTERGWPGHFILAKNCEFRRNTLLQCGSKAIVVSTVGLCEDPLKKGSYMELGGGRYYETMAFYADPKDTRYHDADVQRRVKFDSPWAILKLDADDKANEMHEKVVGELIKKITEEIWKKKL